MKGNSHNVSPKAYRGIQNLLHHTSHGHMRRTYRDSKVHKGHATEISGFSASKSRRAGQYYKKLNSTTQQRVRETVKSHVGKVLMSFSQPRTRDNVKKTAEAGTDPAPPAAGVDAGVGGTDTESD